MWKVVHLFCFWHNFFILSFALYINNVLLSYFNFSAWVKRTKAEKARKVFIKHLLLLLIAGLHYKWCFSGRKTPADLLFLRQGELRIKAFCKVVICPYIDTPGFVNAFKDNHLIFQVSVENVEWVTVSFPVQGHYL